MQNKTTTEFVKYYLTEDEKRELAADLAQKTVEMQLAEDDKKAIASDFKSQIDGLSAKINGAANKLTTGYEMRSVKCEIVPDWTKKVWQSIEIDSGNIVKERPMTSDDLQIKIDEVTEG